MRASSARTFFGATGSGGGGGGSAEATTFDNSSNGYNADNVQNAIEETRLTRKTIFWDMIVPTDFTWLQHDPLVTGSILVEGTGELLIL